MTRCVYEIRDMLGETIAEHVKVVWPGGKKIMSWRLPGCDPRDGLMGLSTPDLPLYGSERLPCVEVGRTVIVCEGEGATEALWSLGLDAVGTVTGASATPGEDALSVLLPYDVVLWPDHDREGHRHMNRVAWALHRLSGHMPRAIVPERLHDDRSPSFKVDTREPFFRCFGCDARGDVFEFLKRIEGVGFKDALRELAPPKLLGAAIPW
jgi:hypothetical protein